MACCLSCTWTGNICTWAFTFTISVFNRLMLMRPNRWYSRLRYYSSLLIVLLNIGAIGSVTASGKNMPWELFNMCSGERA